jgi:hypothetical protein
VTGGAIGGIVGPLAGSDTLAIPGRGPFFAAGSIVAALSCAAEGATAGGSVGALVGLGIPEYEAKACEEQIAFLRAPKADQTEKGPQKRSRDARLHPFTLTITPFEHSL